MKTATEQTTTAKAAELLLKKTGTVQAITELAFKAEQLGKKAGAGSAGIAFRKFIGARRPNGHRVITYIIGHARYYEPARMLTLKVNSTQSAGAHEDVSAFIKKEMGSTLGKVLGEITPDRPEIIHAEAILRD